MKKVISLVLVIVVIFALGAGISVFADYDFLVPADGYYVHYITQGTSASIDLLVYPYYAGGYSTSNDATLTWTLVSGSTSGVTIDQNSITGVEIDVDSYWAYAKVNVSNTAAPGAAAVMATDGQGNYVTIVIVINPLYGPSDHVTGVTCYYYDARSSTESLKATVTGISAQWNTHYSETHYVSALDATLHSYWNSSDIANLVINTDQSPSPYIVDSVRFDGETETLKNGYSYYVSEGHQDNVTDYNMGWLYRVYRCNGTTYTMIPISEYLGPNQFALQNNDIILWKFGDYSTVTFPTTLN